MNRQLPPLNWLRTFEAAARQLSFTAAARELHLTQAAVSQHVKLLEQHLGQRLFERLARSVRLTAAGEAYQPRLAELFDRLADETAGLFGSRREGTLTVRASAAFSALWLAPRVTRFRAVHPEIELRVVNLIWPVEHLEEGVDLDLRYGDGRWRGLRAERVTDEQLVPVMAPSAHRRGARRELAQRLRERSLIHVLGYRDGWPQWFAAAGLEPIERGDGEYGQDIHCDNSIMALELAAADCGVALLHSSLVEAALASGRVRRMPGPTPPAADHQFLVYPHSRRLSAPAATFREWLLATARGREPSKQP